MTTEATAKTTDATIKWVELVKGSPRVTIWLRVRHIVKVPHGVDPATARYKGYRIVTKEREQKAYCWRDSVPGALIASLCERAEQSQQPLRVDYVETPWGWRLTSAAMAQPEPGPPAGALAHHGA